MLSFPKSSPYYAFSTFTREIIVESIHILAIGDYPLLWFGIQHSLANTPIETAGPMSAKAYNKQLVARLGVDVLLWISGDSMSTQRSSYFQAAIYDSSVLILYLGGCDDAEWVSGLIDAGLYGYMLLDETSETLVGAIQTVARGEKWLSPRLGAKMARQLRGGAGSMLHATGARCVTATAKGWTNGQIEEALGISANTVRFHLKNIYRKLEVDGRGAAIITTLKLGIV